MKRKSKRYSTRKEILDAIEDKHFAVAMANKLADQYDAEADELKTWMAKNPSESAASERQKQEWHGRFKRFGECKKESASKRKSIPRLNNELLRLKHALAEFDTQPMSFIESDTSVKV